MDVQRLRVYTGTLNDNHETVDVALLPADRMRAERASTKELAPSQRGADAAKANPHTWTLLYLWCAFQRMGLTSAPFTSWADTVLDYDRLRPDGEPITDAAELAELEDETLDPTQPGGPTTGP